MEERFSWIPFYKEFGQKLLKYRDDRNGYMIILMEV